MKSEQSNEDKQQCYLESINERLNIHAEGTVRWGHREQIEVHYLRWMNWPTRSGVWITKLTAGRRTSNLPAKQTHMWIYSCVQMIYDSTFRTIKTESQFRLNRFLKGKHYKSDWQGCLMSHIQYICMKQDNRWEIKDFSRENLWHWEKWMFDV